MDGQREFYYKTTPIKLRYLFDIPSLVTLPQIIVNQFFSTQEAHKPAILHPLARSLHHMHSGCVRVVQQTVT